MFEISTVFGYDAFNSAPTRDSKSRNLSELRFNRSDVNVALANVTRPITDAVTKFNLKQ